MNACHQTTPIPSSCTDSFHRKGGRFLRKYTKSAAGGRFISADGRAGFTLLEILVAIIILSMVLTTVYAAYTGTFRIINQTQYSDAIYGMARTALMRMTEDLASICTYDGVYSFVSTSSEIGDTEFMNLTFLSSAHLSFDGRDASGISSISYTITEGSEDTGPILMREDVLYSGNNESETEEAGGHILCNQLQSLTYTFYDNNSESYETWDSNSETHRDKAPAVVSISLNFINPDDKEHPYAFMTKVYLPKAGAANATVAK